MKKNTKTVLFTGLGLLCTGLLLCVIVFALNGCRLRPVDDSQETGSKNPETFETTVSDAFKDIEINVSSTDVVIQKSSDSHCLIRFENVVNASQFETQVQGETLTIKSNDASAWDWKNPSQILENLFANLENGFSEDGKLILSLPEDAYRRLSIATASGDVSSKEAFSFSEVNLASASGDVSAEKLKDAVTINIATASGEIEVSDFSAESALNVASASGDIHVTACNQDFSKENTGSTLTADITSTSGEIALTDTMFASGTLHTTSGDVSLENVGSENMEIDTTSGDVTGRLSDDYHVEASTVSGKVSVPAGTRGSWRIETVSGDITLKT